jgi:pimeloyl-ACP methyl ester carboxylesterase
MKTPSRGPLIGLGLIVALVMVAAVGWLALQRQDIPYETLEAKYASPASRYMELPGGLRVHYRDEGPRDGPALVLLHGYSASLHAWEPWVRTLSDDYRVITLDLPGHGLTRTRQPYAAGREGYEAIVDQLTTRLGVQRFTLGGNSMGGGVAWRYALAHPDRIEGLVLVDAAGWPSVSPERPLIFKILQTAPGRAVLKNIDTRPLIRQGLRDAYLDPGLVTPRLVDRYVELARAPGHRDILLSLQTGDRRVATPKLLATIKAPTLVMFGQGDKVIPASDGQRFASAMPGSTLILYPNVGHMPMEQIPDRSVADLKAWLRAKVYPATPTP